jgi:hypothetical protein
MRFERINVKYGNYFFIHNIDVNTKVLTQLIPGYLAIVYPLIFLSPPFTFWNIVSPLRTSLPPRFL